MARPSGNFGGLKPDLRANVFTASGLLGPLKIMPTPKQSASFPQFDRQAHLQGSAGETSNHDGR